jgi:transcription antitermination protein NusB
MTSRRLARRVALILLYQHDITGRSVDELADRYRIDTGSAIPDYTRSLVDEILEDPARFDVLIAEHAHGWTPERISPIERACLRIAVLELVERADVPPSVAINEAVSLAKRYASPEAAVFVNGVLGGVARALGVGH